MDFTKTKNKELKNFTNEELIESTEWQIKNFQRPSARNSEELSRRFITILKKRTINPTI